MIQKIIKKIKKEYLKRKKIFYYSQTNFSKLETNYF